MMISVIVPTYNRVLSLGRLLDAIRSQTLPTKKFEVIVVDDGSTDGTNDYLSKFSKIIDFNLLSIRQNNQGPSAARNAGIRHSVGELIVFTDDDCIPDVDWLRYAYDFFSNNNSATGCGGKIVRSNDTPISKWIDRQGIMRHPLNIDGTVEYLVTANAAYLRVAIEAVNGFREDISWPGGEDPDLSFRVRSNGGRLFYCPNCIIKHEHRDTYQGLYKMFYNHGKGNVFCHFENLKDKKLGEAKGIFINYVRKAIMNFLANDLSVRDRWTELTCGFLRAVAFTRGYLYQLKRLSKNS